MDKDNLYPTKADLTHLKELGKLESKKELAAQNREILNFIHSIWRTPEWGYIERKGKNILDDDCLIVEFRTGGWSGNEDAIDALRETFFWWFYWSASHRGGHYWFEIPLSQVKLRRRHEQI